MANRQQEPNYLYIGVGGLFLIAFLVLAAYMAYPFEGCIGVVEIKGEIISSDIAPSLFSGGVDGSETIASQIGAADAREEVKSMLFIIDSPGGSAVATRQVYDAVASLGKPSVSYINEMATSGGYYVAAGTDYIVANPDSITGNVGARATLFDMSGLFEKIGLNETTIKSGSMKDMGSSARPATPEEYAVFESIVNESYQEFKSAVEGQRGARLDKAGWAQAQDARMLSGRQAKKIGMVDALGDKKAAIAKAAQLGNITGTPRICGLSSAGERKGLFSGFSSEAVEFFLRSQLGTPRLSYQ